MTNSELFTESRFKTFVDTHSRPSGEDEGESKSGIYSVDDPDSFVPVDEAFFYVEEEFESGEQVTPSFLYTISLRRISPDKIISDLFSLEWKSTSEGMDAEGSFSETTGGDSYYDIPNDLGRVRAERLIKHLEELELLGRLVEIATTST